MWGTSPADRPHRQLLVLQVRSSAHIAFKAIALAWILVYWCPASSGVCVLADILLFVVLSKKFSRHLSYLGLSGCFHMCVHLYSDY